MSKTNYPGIDYSLGRSNINHKTGIRYGVIHSREVGQAWYDESEPLYIYYCPECEFCFDYLYPDEPCLSCGYKFQGDEYDMLDPVSFVYEDESIAASQCFDDTDIFIFESPYYTWCQFCSPCAPGAGYLINYTDPGIGIKAYCFGHEWYEGEKAPYPVYDAKTNEVVQP